MVCSLNSLLTFGLGDIRVLVLGKKKAASPGTWVCATQAAASHIWEVSCDAPTEVAGPVWSMP